jgi:RING finger protein 121
MTGYFVILVSFLHIPVMFGFSDDEETDVFVCGVLCMFYGMYFGTLGMDFVDRLILVFKLLDCRIEWLLQSVIIPGLGFLLNILEIMCVRYVVYDYLIIGDPTSTPGIETYELNCAHVFHYGCIK